MDSRRPFLRCPRLASPAVYRARKRAPRCPMITPRNRKNRHFSPESSKFLPMTTTNTDVLSIARLNEKGEFTIPAEYRREHGLDRDSTIAIIQMGDALILTPIDKMLAEITERMEAAIRVAGVTVAELMEETFVARTEIAREEFGEET
jgi:bifunctional DNA-binding transcriptional regulator/antitoxin component of YhaV-PrlF toxin-antitoxin module